jgi:hypothetical protein
VDQVINNRGAPQVRHCKIFYLAIDVKMD